MGIVSSRFVGSSDEFDDGHKSDYVNDKVQPSLNNQWNDDEEDNDGVKLLSIAQEGLRSNHLISILRKNPALIHIGDPLGDTVLHMVVRVGHIETVCNLIEFLEKQGWLLKKTVMEDQNSDGDTALHLALKNGHEEVAFQLVKLHKRAAWIADNDGIIPYKLAEEAGNIDLCFFVSFEYCSGVIDVDMGVVRNDLIKENASVHWTKLYKAIKNGQENVLINGLKEHGKEVLMQQDKGGVTLLHAAVDASGMGALRQIVEFMIGNGLRDTAFMRNGYGNTALHEAVVGEQWSKVACLIKVAPETVYQVNHKGISPLYLAVKGGHQDIVKLMLSRSCGLDCGLEILKHPKHSTLAYLAIKVRSFGTLQTVMEHLPNLINEKDEKGWRPLSYAAYRGYLDEVVYFLSNFPKSVNKYDKDGSLPIHKAIGGGHVSVIQAFISHYPKALYHVTKKGQSVLHIAARYAGRSNKADILAYLRKEIETDEAFLSLRDSDGKTYMDYA